MNIQDKRIQEVLAKYNKQQYFETNPAGNLISELDDYGIKATTLFAIPHVSYGTREQIKIEVENKDYPIILNLYRMDSGRYEVNAYDSGAKLKSKNKNTI